MYRWGAISKTAYCNDRALLFNIHFSQWISWTIPELVASVSLETYRKCKLSSLILDLLKWKLYIGHSKQCLTLQMILMNAEFWNWQPLNNSRYMLLCSQTSGHMVWEQRGRNKNKSYHHHFCRYLEKLGFLCFLEFCKIGSSDSQCGVACMERDFL